MLVNSGSLPRLLKLVHRKWLFPPFSPFANCSYYPIKFFYKFCRLISSFALLVSILFNFQDAGTILLLCKMLVLKYFFKVSDLNFAYAKPKYLSCESCLYYTDTVGTNGLEPSTSRLSGVRSNHLSYAPKWILPRLWLLSSALLVEMRRIELLTPCVQGRCSPS